MKNSTLIRLIALTIAVILGAIFYTLYPSELSENIVFLTAVLLLIISASNLVYGIFLSSKQRTNTARIGSIGVTATLSFILFLISCVGAYQAIAGTITTTNVINILTIGLFFLQFFIVKATTNVLDSVEDETVFNSAHLRWAAALVGIAEECSAPELKIKIEKFAENCRYLGRDLSPAKNEINLKIEETIKKLSKQVNGADLRNAEIAFEELCDLTQKRERQLKELRSKA